MQLQVARIGKPHGIRGEVTVQVLTDAPEDRFVPGTEFVVEPASAGPLTVRSARWNKDILLLGFEEIETRNERRDPPRRQAVHRDRRARRGRRRGLVRARARRPRGPRRRCQVVGKVSGAAHPSGPGPARRRRNRRQGNPDSLRGADRPRGQRRRGVHPASPRRRASSRSTRTTRSPETAAAEPPASRLRAGDNA